MPSTTGNTGDQGGDKAGLPKPLVITWTVLLVVVILALVTIWIMFVIAANALSVAKKKGERLQALCGAEYMEIESDRHAIQKAYSRLGSTLVLAIGMTTFTALIGITVVHIPHAVTLTKESYTDMGALFMVGLLYYCLHAAFWTMTFLDLMYVLPNLKKMVKYQNIVSLKTKRYFNGYAIASISIVFGIGAFYLWTVNKTKGDHTLIAVRLLLVFSMIALIGFKLLIGSDILSMTEKAVIPYDEKVRALNTEIRNLLTKNETKLAMETHLRRNIRRIHPDMEIEPVLNPSLGKSDPFYDKYYLYVEHRGGKESIESMDNTTRISLKTMKSLLGKMYTSNTEFDTYGQTTVSTATLIGLPTISMENLKTAKFHSSPQTRSIREWIYKLFMGTRNQDDISFSKKDFETAFKLYKSPLNSNSNALSNRLNQMYNGSEVNVSYFRQMVNSSNPKEETAKTMSKSDGSGSSGGLPAGGSNVEQFQGTTTTQPVIPPNDIEDLIHSTLLVSDAYVNTSVAIDDVFTKLAADTNMDVDTKNAIAHEITLYKDTSAMQSLQNKMRDLRNMSPVMNREVNRFVKHVFWASLVIMLIVGFIVFHMIYKKLRGNDPSKDLRGMLVMMIALVMLLLIIAGAMYQWIMGVTQL